MAVLIIDKKGDPVVLSDDNPLADTDILVLRYPRLSVVEGMKKAQKDGYTKIVNHQATLTPKGRFKLEQVLNFRKIVKPLREKFLEVSIPAETELIEKQKAVNQEWRSGKISREEYLRRRQQIVDDYREATKEAWAAYEQAQVDALRRYDGALHSTTKAKGKRCPSCRVSEG
jgi:hypothetical protein